MIIREKNGNTTINLSKSFDNRAKILNFIYFILFTGAGAAFIYLPISEGGPYVLGVFIFIGIVSGIYLFAAYRFVNKALVSEKIIVNQKRLTISRSCLFKRKNKTFEISKISNFRHLEKPEISKHPLAGEQFDYLGFQTEQTVIDEMHGDNRLGFDYDGKTITFGENIYSWDFEKIRILLYNITGKDFQFQDEFEKKLEN